VAQCESFTVYLSSLHSYIHSYMTPFIHHANRENRSDAQA
jgi:hypothetical protein